MHIKKMSEYGNDMVSGNPDDEYPWGTRLDLNDEMVKELGIDNLPAGATVNLKAVGFVKKKNTEEEVGEESETYLCIQLTELDVKQVDTRDRATMLYGDSADRGE